MYRWDFVRLNNSLVTIFEKSINALFSRDLEKAEKIFMELKDIRKAHNDLSAELLQPGNVQSAILQKQ